jgi:hypothetical protein
MSTPTAAFRDEHRHLMTHVGQIRLAGGEVSDLGIEERRELVGRVLD